MRPGITQQVTRLRAATNPYPGEGGEEEYGELAGLLEFSGSCCYCCHHFIQVLLHPSCLAWVSYHS